MKVSAILVLVASVIVAVVHADEAPMRHLRAAKQQHAPAKMEGQHHSALYQRAANMEGKHHHHHETHDEAKHHHRHEQDDEAKMEGQRFGVGAVFHHAPANMEGQRRHRHAHEAKMVAAHHA